MVWRTFLQNSWHNLWILTPHYCELQFWVHCSGLDWKDRQWQCQTEEGKQKGGEGIELPGRQSDIGENIKFNQISSQVQPKTNTPSSRSKNCSLSMEIKILVGISIIIKTYMCSCYNFLILVKAKKDPFLMWPNTNPIWSKKCGKTLVVRSG